MATGRGFARILAAVRNSLFFVLLASLGVACNGSGTGGTPFSIGSTGGTGGSGSSGVGGSDGGTSGPTEPDPKLVPKPTGACPELATGKNTFTPAGIAARDVLVWFSDASATADGPLVFFWHGAGGSPDEATYAIGAAAMTAIQDAGGMVVAPYHDPGAGELNWYLALGGVREDDLQVADEVLACAIEKKGVDLRRVHSIGFSAGAMHTTQFAARRSGYVASVVTYSGAQIGVPPVQDPENKYPAMLFHGGSTDQVVIKFEDAAHSYQDWLTSEGHFSFLCGHGKGHTVPLDGRESAWTFLSAHPFGASPEPYAKGLPAGFPTYCAL
jgi:predicted esterase